MKKSRLLTMVNMIILMLLIFTLVLSITSTIGLYNYTVQQNEISDNTRISSNYLVNKIREYDGAPSSDVAVKVSKFNGVDALYFIHTDNETKYFDIIYKYNQKLYELMCENIEDFELEDGEEIMDAAEFSISALDRYNVGITYKVKETDPQQVIVTRIRSGKTYER